MNEKRDPREKYPLEIGMIGEVAEKSALVTKSLISQFIEVEKQAAKNLELSAKLRKEASRRASLLELAWHYAWYVLEALIDANADDGVADLESEWELEDRGYDKKK